MADFKTGQKIYKISLERLLVLESKKVLKNKTKPKPKPKKRKKKRYPPPQKNPKITTNVKQIHNDRDMLKT